MKFPIEEVFLGSIFLLVVISLSTCSTPNKKTCNVIHEAAKPAHRCEVW